jgi:hypothetical protein
MFSLPLKKLSTVCATLVLELAIPGATGPKFALTESFAEPPATGSPLPHSVVELRDFRDQEVRAAGITVSKDVTVHISAVGGGEEREFWRDLLDDDPPPQMYAAGWIINAETRQPVWEMTYDNTSGSSEHREYDGDINLARGSYEVYFSAHGYYWGNTFSNGSMNIDRPQESHSMRRKGHRFVEIFAGRNDDRYRDFMELAKDWGVTLTSSDEDASAITHFEPPAPTANVIFAAQKLGDGVAVKKSLVVTRSVPIHIYAIGEGRRKEGMFDYGWIVKSDTRERVWEMTVRNTYYAGGAPKNRRFDDDVTLSPGTYELYYTTDDSHSNDDWNAKPPFDPFQYGIALTAAKESDRNAVKVSDLRDTDKNVIVSLTRVRNNDYISSGFSLKADEKVRVYCLGEWDSDDEMADYGWITDAKTHDRVWEMRGLDTYHAGGAQKNRMIDEIITLPKGNYLAYYQTDGSHGYDDWNSDPPFDEEHWGLTVMGAGEKFDPKSVSSFSEEADRGVIAQIIKVSDNKHLRKTFTLAEPTKVRVYAIGEGEDREMYDYGWIEDAKAGQSVWEMTYNMTSNAGGARKNRMVNTTILLDKGDYELRYDSDGSHSFNDWNADPPEDRIHWGITLYKEQ